MGDITAMHPSDSRIQRDIEAKIIKIVEDKLGAVFDKEKKTIIKDVCFEFDFFSKDKKIIGEIYAGIDNLSAGPRKKVITDCFKMVFADTLLEEEYEKHLVFIDDAIMNKFTGDSWICKAIDSYNIKPYVITLDADSIRALKNAREGQKTGNRKKE
jgi:hypothetical protein